MSESKPLVSKRRTRSKVWTYFGYRPDPFGLPEDKDLPVCRLCSRVVITRDGSTSNLYMHLRAHHREEYAILQGLDTKKEPDILELVSVSLKDPVKHEDDDDAKNSESSSQGNDVSDDEDFVIVMKKKAKSAVWQYFGYRQDKQGKLDDRERPTCVLCKRTVTAKGGTTANMRQHLRIHHPIEYNQCRDNHPKTENMTFKRLPNTCQMDDGEKAHQECSDKDNLKVYQPLDKMSVEDLVWIFFGYPPTNDDALDASLPTCLLCKKVCSIKEGGDSLLNHLKENHSMVHSFCQEVLSASSTEVLTKVNSKSTVWMFFGFKANEYGEPQDKNLPYCLLCKKEYTSKGGNTSNLFRHLEKHHPEEHNLCLQVQLENSASSNETTASIGCIPSVLFEDHKNSSDVTELLQPKQKHSPVWKYFGFRPDPGMEEEPLDKDRPTCRLCGRDVVAEGSSTSNLHWHLGKYHTEEYKQCVGPEKAAQIVSSGVLPRPDACSSVEKEDKPNHKNGTDVTEEELLPIQKQTPIWKYFGFRPDPSPGMEDEPLNENKPTCRLCRKDIVAECGSTSNLHRHLGRCHAEEYKKCLGPEKAAQIVSSRLQPPPDACSSVDRPNPRYSTDIKEELLLPQQKHSPIWKYFGFRPDPSPGMNEEPLDEDKPTCRLCRRDVVAEGSSTSNLHRHLGKYHTEEYKQCVGPEKATQIVSSGLLSRSDDCSSVEREDRPNQENFTDVTEGLLLPQQKQSPVWKYFGFRPDPVPGMEELPLDKNKPTCRLCNRDVVAEGTTSNLHWHLGKYHAEEYKQCVGPEKAAQIVSSGLLPPSDMRDDDLSNGSYSFAISFSNIEPFMGSADKISTCHRCNKSLANNEIINNKRAGVKTPLGEIDYDYCWSCFAVLHNIGFTEEQYDPDEDTVVFEAVNDASDASSLTTEADGDAGKTDAAYENTKANLVRRRRQSKDPSVTNYCKICDKKFQRARDLRRHNRRHNEKLLCSVCSKEFVWAYSLKEHEQRHRGITPYKCETCDKGFVNRDKLRRHVMIHTGEKPFLCCVCGKGFNQQGSLKAHERVHSGDRPYPCRMCEKSFVQGTARNTHEKNAHGKVPW